MKNIVLVIFLFLSNPVVLFSQENLSLDTISARYALGEISVLSGDQVDEIEGEKALRLNAATAAHSIAMLPGVSLVNFGSKREVSVSMRGFDLRSVPVYVDGIPVSQAYDGYIDLGRIINKDISSISIYKGRTPLALSANAAGGSINILSSRPMSKVDVKVNASYGTGNKNEAGLVLGTKHERFYLRASTFFNKQDSYPLSHYYDSSTTVQSEDGGFRENAYSRDFNAGIKFGFTPNASDEYSIHYLHQGSERGTPPYAGSDPGQRVRYWQWPYWKKNSLYSISKKRVSDHSFLTFRAFYDNFSNKLESYDNDTYDEQTRGYAFTSYYDDYTLGSNFDYTLSILSLNTMRLTGLIKNDHHAEHNEGEAERNFTDLSYTIGLEDVHSISKFIQLNASIAYAGKMGLLAEDYNSGTGLITEMPKHKSSKFNVQLGLDYLLSSKHKLELSAYSRARFASMKERYSYRAGRGIPNPNLLPERSRMLELKYSGKVKNTTDIGVSVFAGKVDDAIMSVLNPETGLFQAQNLGLAVTSGLELSGDLHALKNLLIHADYSYISMNNLNDPDIYFSHVPTHNLRGVITLSPLARLQCNMIFLYMSDRYSTSYGTVADAFTKTDIRVSYAMKKKLSLSAALSNVFDQDYELAEGFPEPGRMITLGIDYSFVK